MSRFPMSPNPTGWYAVAYSDELPAGAPTPLRYFGRPLVGFRDPAGQPVVLDAICPHLGARLDLGEAKDGCVRCPMHHWTFDASGACVAVPYARKLPRAAVRRFPAVERNGIVMVWYSAAGEEPRWEIPQLAEVGSDEWTPFFRRRWRIRTNLHEMAENGFDMAHFRCLHGLHEMPEPTVVFDGPGCRITAPTVMETPFGVIRGTLDIRSHGLGFGTGRFAGLIDTLLVTTVTPIDEEHVDARFTFTVKKLPDEAATRTVGAGFVDELSRQVEVDIRVWETKEYLPHPVLVAEDAPVAAFRRWARQFYPAEVEPGLRLRTVPAATPRFRSSCGG